MAEFIKVQDLEAPDLIVYQEKKEAALKHIHAPEPGLFIAESAKVVLRALDAGYVPVSLLLEEKGLEGEGRPVAERCREMDIPIYLAAGEILSGLFGYPMTRGVLAAMRRRPLPSPGELIRDAHRIAILEKVENPTNIGAIFRSAAALGMDAVLLTGGCSDPLYRRAARVSMGTVFQIPWTYCPWEKAVVSEAQFADRRDSQRHAKAGSSRRKTAGPAGAEAPPGMNAPVNPTLDLLKKEGFVTAAMALRSESVPVSEKRLKQADRLAVILGTEGEGLASSTISGTDYTVLIPMSHGVDSLNVAAAAAVVFYELAQRE